MQAKGWLSLSSRHFSPTQTLKFAHGQLQCSLRSRGCPQHPGHTYLQPIQPRQYVRLLDSLVPSSVPSSSQHGAVSDVDGRAAGSGGLAEQTDWDEAQRQFHLARQQRLRSSRQLLEQLESLSNRPEAALELEAQGVIPVTHSLLTPPPAWMHMEADIVSRAVAGGCPAAALRTYLTRDHVLAPAVPGNTGRQCLLSRCEQGAVFLSPEINQFLMQVFSAVTAAWTTHEHIPQVHLSRFDLFHAHLLLGPVSETRQGSPSLVSDETTHSSPMGLGLLFHCKEYPAYCPEQFPYMLGWCQQGSPLQHHPRAFDLRNVVWFKGQLAFLDAGVDSPVHSLLWPDTQPLRTIYEGDLGVPLADINLLLKHDLSVPSANNTLGSDAYTSGVTNSRLAAQEAVPTSVPAGLSGSRVIPASPVPYPPELKPQLQAQSTGLHSSAATSTSNALQQDPPGQLTWPALSGLAHHPLIQLLSNVCMLLRQHLGLPAAQSGTAISPTLDDARVASDDSEPVSTRPASAAPAVPSTSEACISHPNDALASSEPYAWWQGQLMHETLTLPGVQEPSSSEHAASDAAHTGSQPGHHTVNSPAWSSLQVSSAAVRTPAASLQGQSQQVADLRQVAILLVCCNESAHIVD